MKSLFALYFWSLIFLSITFIHGSDNERTSTTSSGYSSEEEFFEELKGKLNEIASNGRNISGVLKLTPRGYLGAGGFGLVYKGIRLLDSRPVAIKFINRSNEESAKREYSIYSYLNAIDNPTNERFGIPAIYWYGNWNELIVMAMTLFEESLFDKAYNHKLKEPLDNLIVFQQFIVTSKYIHSCGIRHDDIKGENIMLREDRSFLIDYNLSSEMKKDTNFCTYRFKPRRCHRNFTRYAMDDIESFFYTLCYLNKIELKWFFNNAYDHMNKEERDRKISEDKTDIKHILRTVKAIRSNPMKIVFKAFYKEIFGIPVKEFPDYDALAQIIATEIKKLVPENQPALFTWLNPEEIESVLKRIGNHPLVDIHEDIPDPSKINFDDFKYPVVDFDHFTKTPA